jgi:hypothetical protein
MKSRRGGGMNRFSSGMLSFDGSSRTATLRLGPSSCAHTVIAWQGGFAPERRASAASVAAESFFALPGKYPA